MAVSKIVLLIITVTGAAVSAFVYRDSLRAGVSAIISDGEIAEADQIKAIEDMRKIFNSAQNSFMHRLPVGKRRMARSIEELGCGYQAQGCVIYKDIWLLRFECHEGELLRECDAEHRGELMKWPYRYAVLGVSGLSGSSDDDRTTCVVALPSETDHYPAILMLAGPVNRDPQDFRIDWPVVHIEDRDKILRLREIVRCRGVVDKQFSETYLKGETK